MANAAKEEADVRKVAGLAAKKGAADEAAGSNAKAIEKAAVEKATGSLACLATVKNAADKAASSHAKNRVSNNAFENVAAKVATEKLTAREHTFVKPKKIDRKLSHIFLYAPKDAIEQKLLLRKELLQ